MNTLLYLEDDEALAMVTIRAMSRRGFEVTHHPSIASIKQDQNTYTHALLDLRLEDGNALEIIEALIKNTPSMKVLILTGYASITTAVNAIKLGAANYLSKPTTAEQIVKAFDETNTQIVNIEDEQLSLKRMEWEHIQQALADNSGNISATARQLKMHRRTLQRKLAKKPTNV